MTLFNFIQFVKCWRNVSGLKPKGPHLSLEKEKEKEKEKQKQKQKEKEREREKEKEKEKDKDKEKEKENLCVVFTYAITRAREIRKFPVVVVQRRQRNVQNSAMHVQSCCLLI